jgi:hypothetical protein
MKEQVDGVHGRLGLGDTQAFPSAMKLKTHITRWGCLYQTALPKQAWRTGIAL